jgi:hypothetical protein
MTGLVRKVFAGTLIPAGSYKLNRIARRPTSQQ